MEYNRLMAGVALTLSICMDALSQINVESFLHPSSEMHPWVYWMWVNGNVCKDGVEKDLEAMHRVGINGAIVLDVDQYSPNGPVVYNDKAWQDIFRHTAATAQRLGMEIGTNNGAGYWGSGGPWVTPEKAMQWVVSSETYVRGKGHWKGILKSPGTGEDYRDIAVIAIGVVDTMPELRFNIPDFPLKSCQNPGNAGEVRYSHAPATLAALQWPGFPRYLAYRGTQSAPLDKEAPAKAVIPMDKVMDISSLMAKDGSLEWDVPEGEWTIIRFGHQWTGSCIGPVTDKAIGPETDKLSKEVTRFHFNKIVKELQQCAASRAFTTIHIDSWEGGGQNWTEGMELIFRQRRGYELTQWLPVLTGRVINSLQETERFMFDLRLTVSELFVENYVAEMQRLAHDEGLKLSYEGYTTPANDMDVMQYIDVPMAEFWIPIGWHPNFDPTIKLMASAAHLNGTPIVAAEALTASGAERWQWHPSMMKPLVDAAFCGGVNRLVFHRYSSQYFDVEGPGIQMNMWGSKYERTNTWWEFSSAWHEYVARCQSLLQAGTFCADVLALQSEEPGRLFAGYELKGYDYDVIGSAAFRRATADDGGCLYASRPAYRLILLPETETMTVDLLDKIRELVYRGAAVLGRRPRSVPGLHNYKAAEKRLQNIADELWGKEEDDVQQRRVGKGMVFSGISAEEALRRLGVCPDFSSDHHLEYIHRTIGGEECYFVANTSEERFTASCAFRVNGLYPEVWDAETGKRYAVHRFDDANGATRLELPFSGNQSWFVVFRSAKDASLPILPLVVNAVNEAAVEGSWTLCFPPKWELPDTLLLPSLMAWNEHDNLSVRYFSGTARYEKFFYVRPEMLSCHLPLKLDLGRVEVMAKARLNGKDLGIAWHAPYSFDITQVATIGENRLEIEVVNLWPNRLIGDEQLPDDVGYDNQGTMKQWPEWLTKGEKRPTSRAAFTARRQWKANDMLLPSGLLGPVRIYNDSVVTSFAQTKPRSAVLWGDQGDGTFRNPIIAADYSDPDPLRVGDDYYMVASTFEDFPGVAILHSKDLVNWTTVGAAFTDLAAIDPAYTWTKMERYNGGVYAPTLSYHNGKYYIYANLYTDGFYMATADHPTGPWTSRFVKDKHGRPLRVTHWTDPSPFWDEDGKAYLVASHPGRKYWYSYLFQMSEDGTTLLDADSLHMAQHNTLYAWPDGGTVISPYHSSEGNRLFKRNGYYYLQHIEFTNDGQGAGTYIFRSRHLYGTLPDGNPGQPGNPGAYEAFAADKVDNQGLQRIPGQGGYVTTPDGRWWWVGQFNRNYAYGRPPHLLPVAWIDDWPVIGNRPAGGEGQMVWHMEKPIQGYAPMLPQGSDEFSAPQLAAQWSWNHQPQPGSWSLTARPGYLRLYAAPSLDGKGFFKAANTLHQRYLYGQLTEATVRMAVDSMADGQLTGLAHFDGGKSYAAIGVEAINGHKTIYAETNGARYAVCPLSDDTAALFFRTVVGEEGIATFQYSLDGNRYEPLGEPYQLTFGNFRGDRIGIFTYNDTGNGGSVDVDWFRYSVINH